MDIQDVLNILEDVPDYKSFLTVDELKASSRCLAEEYPTVVQLVPGGKSRQGDAIDVLQIGSGEKHVLLFAMPHPNEPIGSMMLEYLSRRLAEDDALREAFGYTWHIIKCIDPDGTRLNEGWFKGSFSVANYARHFYRPPSFQQVEWTFPIHYKTLHFDDPLPETQVLMRLIQEYKPDFIYSLHNSGFGGAYFYLSEEAPSLYKPFHRLVESQGLPLHLGESEMPYATRYDDAIFFAPPISQSYDFLAKQTGADPAEIIKGGTSSFDYARPICNPFTLVCEMPYFYNPAIEDTSPSDMTRREAILEGVRRARQDFDFVKQYYALVQDDLIVSSPFRDAIEECLRTFERRMEAQENWARTDPETDQVASVAARFDSLVVDRFYRLLMLGMFVRMLEAQIEADGSSRALAEALKAAEQTFAERSEALEAALDYSVIPIRKLVSVQLGSALLAATYAAGR